MRLPTVKVYAGPRNGVPVGPNIPCGRHSQGLASGGGGDVRILGYCANAVYPEELEKRSRCSCKDPVPTGRNRH